MPANPHPLDAAARDELARKARAAQATASGRWYKPFELSDVADYGWDAEFLAACTPDVILALLAAVERGAEDTRDAARWRALLACDRVRVLGGCTRGYPAGRGVFGVEFYGAYPDANNPATIANREELTAFADGLLAARAHPDDTPELAARYRAELQRVAEECGQPDAWESAAQLVRAKLMHYDELIAERDSAHVALTVARVAVRDLNILVSNLPPRRATHKESTAIREGFERVYALLDEARTPHSTEREHA